MLKTAWFDTLGVSRKDFIAVFILAVNALTWIYMTSLVIGRFQESFSLTTSEVFIIRLTYLVSIIGSSIVGYFTSKTPKFSFLCVWMAIGAGSAFLPIMVDVSPYLLSFALGSSLGVGMPACLAYFANNSKVENRGSLGGIIFFATYLLAALLAVALGVFDFQESLTILAIWRAAGLLLFILINPKFTAQEEARRFSFSGITKDRSMYLYLVPWILFAFTDRFEQIVFRRYIIDPSISSALIAGPIISSFSALFGGLLLDRIGRKRVSIAAFAAMGLSYAVIGMAPNQLISWYFYSIVDGIAWGILFVTFLLTVWGDLSHFNDRVKYYVLGGTPFYFAYVTELLLSSYVEQMPEYTAFSLASLFLFIAVLPLLYAPETLPQKHIELQQFKRYIDHAKKEKDKQTSKS